MRLFHHFHILAMATLLVTGSQLYAQFNGYGITKNAFFTQTSKLPPGLSSASFSGHLFASRTGEVTAATIETPTGQQLTDTGDRFLFFSSPSYFTLAALDADFPNGAYTFRITAGSLSPASASVSFPAENMFPAIPYFNEDTFDRLATYDACQSFTFTWNEFVPHPNVSDSFVNFSISPEPFGMPIFSSPSTNSATVPGGILKPNTAYRASLAFSNERRTENAGFGNFDSVVGFTYFVDLNFMTRPDMKLDGLVIRCSQVELCWSSVSNSLHQIQYRDPSLTSTQWFNLGSRIRGDGLCKCVTDEVPQGRPQRIYRFVTTSE